MNIYGDSRIFTFYKIIYECSLPLSVTSNSEALSPNALSSPSPTTKTFPITTPTAKPTCGTGRGRPHFSELSSPTILPTKDKISRHYTKWAVSADLDFIFFCSDYASGSWPLLI